MKIIPRAWLGMGLVLVVAAESMSSALAAREGDSATPFVWLAHRTAASQLQGAREQAVRIGVGGGVQLAVVEGTALLTLCEGRLASVTSKSWPEPWTGPAPDPEEGGAASEGPAAPLALSSRLPAVVELASTSSGTFHSQLMDPGMPRAARAEAFAESAVQDSRPEPSAPGLYARSRPLPEADPRIEPPHLSISAQSVTERGGLGASIGQPLRWVRVGEADADPWIRGLGQKFDRRRPLRIAVGDDLFLIRFSTLPAARPPGDCEWEGLLSKG